MIDQKTFPLLAVAAATALLAVPAAAMAHGPHGGGGPHGPGAPGPGFIVERLAERLELSAEQRADIEALMAAHRARVEPWHEELAAAREAVRGAVEAETFDEEAIRAAAAEVARLEVELAVERARFGAELGSVLTREQQAALAELRESRRGMGRRGPGGFHRGPRGRWGGPPAGGG